MPPEVYLYVRVALGLIFTIAATTKLISHREFARAVVDFRMVPPRLAAPVSRAVAVLELVGGGALLLGYLAWLGGMVLGVLLVAFTAGLILNLGRGRRQLDCRCFGRRTVRIGWGHVAQNALLLGVCVWVSVSSLWHPAAEAEIARTASLLTILAGVYSAIAFVAMQEFLNVRVALVSRLSDRPRAAD